MTKVRGFFVIITVCWATAAFALTLPRSPLPQQQQQRQQQSIDTEVSRLLKTVQSEIAAEQKNGPKNSNGAASPDHPELLTEEDQKLAGIATLEGDMILEGGNLPSGYHDPSLPDDIQFDVVADKNKTWPNGRVPYKIDERFTDTQKSLLELAMRALENGTCLKFEAKTENDENYLFVRKVVLKCYSNVGYENKPRQWINFATSCFKHFGTILHEFMHTLGFYHSQSRDDRDKWITVHWDKIQPGAVHNFQKITIAEIDDQGQQYDYGSLMHYPVDGFALKKGDITLSAKEPLPAGVVMGQRKALSALDRKKINILYNCKEAVVCAADELQCQTVNSTTPSCAKKCDGFAQCADGSDENNCPKPVCLNLDEFWPCDTVKCIRKSWICDGNRDCLNGEDEKKENCPSRQCEKSDINCGKCVPIYRACDGMKDCPNGEDEDAKFCANNGQRPSTAVGGQLAQIPTTASSVAAEAYSSTRSPSEAPVTTEETTAQSTTEQSLTAESSTAAETQHSTVTASHSEQPTTEPVLAEPLLRTESSTEEPTTVVPETTTTTELTTTTSEQRSTESSVPTQSSSSSQPSTEDHTTTSEQPSVPSSPPPPKKPIPRQQTTLAPAVDPYPSHSTDTSGYYLPNSYQPQQSSNNGYYNWPFSNNFGNYQFQPFGGSGGYFSPYSSNHLGYDAVPTVQRHCFFDLASLQDRPEIQLRAENFKYIVEESDTKLCNVINLGFASIDAENLDITLDDSAVSILSALVKAKEELLLSGIIIVMGSDASTESDPAINALQTIGNDVTRAEKFAANTVATLRRWNVTGLSLQWLKPQAEDRPALLTLTKSLAKALQYDPALHKADPMKRLIFSVNVVPEIQPGQNKEFILDTVDYINVIPDRDAARNAKRTFYTNQLLSLLSTDRTVKSPSWLDAKSFKRINIGVHFNAISWTLASNKTNIVGSAVRSLGGPGPLSGTSGTMNVGEICLLNNTKWLKSTDATTPNAAYAYNVAARQWLAYETPDSLQAKLKNANLKRFNGVYMMDVQNDDIRGLCGSDKQYELLKAMSDIDKLAGLISDD